jgi:predicted metal-dependent hydrolase
MRSRWGSCSHKNSIVFNSQLVKAPLQCIDYVVVHELCHTLHHDHGPGFKHLLDNVMPDWKTAADLLKNLPVLL